MLQDYTIQEYLEVSSHFERFRKVGATLEIYAAAMNITPQKYLAIITKSNSISENNRRK